MTLRTGVALAMFIAVAGQSRAQEPRVLEDSPGIMRMIASADAEGLKKLGSGKGMTATAARAGYYQVMGDFDTSVHTAQRCVATPSAQETPNAYFLCQMLLAGGEFLQGDYDGWARGMLEARKTFDESLAGSLGSAKENGLDIDFASFLGRPRSATLDESRPVSPVTLPLIKGAPFPAIRGKVSGSSNGRGLNVDVDFIVDTGSPISVISQGFAKAVDLPSTPKLSDISLRPGSTTISLASPVDLELGAVKLRNVQFVIIEGNELPIIGLDVLQQLGGLRLDSEQMTILDPSVAEQCTHPIYSSSSVIGANRHLWYQLKLDGGVQRVMSDTGSDQALTATGVEGAPGTRKAKQLTIQGLRETSVADIGVRNISLGQRDVPLLAIAKRDPGMYFKQSWVLGWGSRDKLSFAFDLGKGKGCLLAGEAR